MQRPEIPEDFDKANLSQKILVFFASNPDHGRLTVADVVRKWGVGRETAKSAIFRLREAEWIEGAELVERNSLSYRIGSRMREELGM